MGVTLAALRNLKDYLYQLYAEAGTPPVQHIASEIEKDDSFRGSPSKATVHRIIGNPELAAGQEDVVAVAGLLAREAGRDESPVVQEVRRLWVAAQLAQPLGRTVPDLDPFALEVHRAIIVPGQESLPELPVYVSRGHDEELGGYVDRVIGGESLLVTLIGESSTGKTRACWEALRRLPAGWRVWHPYDPTRPEAALEQLAEAGPRTVIWLNEAQHYLLAPDARTAERITAALRTALTDARRGPLLVLATIWPRFWHPLTVPSATGADDPYEQQRKLLTGAGRYVLVPKAFTGPDLREAHRKAADDPRLAFALDGAAGGEITQFLAGVPELMTRYRCAPRGAKALIHTAMDYRRLGHGPALPLALLAGAAEGCLPDRELDLLGDSWLNEALEYCATPCNGVPGPLTRVPSRSAETGEATYRLADYLEQQGRLDRRLSCPPASFWEAAVRHCRGPENSASLARAAESRGRLRYAAALYRRALEAGNTLVRPDLAALLEGADKIPEAQDLYEQALKDDKRGRWELVRLREITGQRGGAEELAHLAANQGNVTPLTRLTRMRQESGDTKGVERLMRNAASRGTIGTFASLAVARESAGDRAGAQSLAFAALQRTDSTYALSELVRMRERVGDPEGAERLAKSALWKGKVRPLIRLAWMRRGAGDREGAERLLALASDTSTFALTELARLKKRAGDPHGAERLLSEATYRRSPFALTELARLREKAGDVERALALYRSAARLGSTDARAHLALLSEQAGASEEAERMACSAADAGSTFALMELVWLREKSQDPRSAERLADTAHRAANSGALVLLARLREEAGDKDAAERLVLRAARAGHSCALHEFVFRRENVGDGEGAERLATEGGGFVLAELAQRRESAGHPDDAERLYRRAAALGEVQALVELARLKEDTGAREEAEALTRDAAHAGRVEAFSRLAHLRARQGRTQDADRLLRAAADAGDGEALAHLVELRRARDPDAGRLLRFGLTADGETSPPW
ncbi:hypothetical protein ACFVW2_10185 [Streptomyces sp. NPDC058171]